MRGNLATPKTERTTKGLTENATSPQPIQDAPETSNVEDGPDDILGGTSGEVSGMGTQTSPTEVETPDFFDVEERIEHPAHPLNYLCEGCKEVVRGLERAAYVLKYQPIFHFFTLEQLFEMEDYLTGEDRDTMKLPAPNQNAPQQHNSNNNRGGIPFLKSEHVDATPRTATILDTRYDEDDKFGAQVVVKISFGAGRNFKWGLRVGGKKENPNYGILVEKFGDDTDNWKGQKVQIALQADQFNEKEWPTVVGFGEQDAVKTSAKK